MLAASQRATSSHAPESFPRLATTALCSRQRNDDREHASCSRVPPPPPPPPRFSSANRQPAKCGVRFFPHKHPLGQLPPAISDSCGRLCFTARVARECRTNCTGISYGGRSRRAAFFPVWVNPVCPSRHHDTTGLDGNGPDESMSRLRPPPLCTRSRGFSNPSIDKTPMSFHRSIDDSRASTWSRCTGSASQLSRLIFPYPACFASFPTIR